MAMQAGGVVNATGLTLTATFASIGVEVPFTGDDNGNASAGLQFKKSSDADWREGLPLWRADDGQQRTFFGSALLLNPDTAYDVRVILSDPDGAASPAALTDTIPTRTEDIGAAGDLVPTQFVRVGGNDANDGASPGSAWATLDAAFKSAPPGAIVQVGPGYFTAPTLTRKSPITLVAQYPAIDDNREPIHTGQHSVVEPAGVSVPAGAQDGLNAGVWQRVALVGPTSGENYTVWTWRGSPVTDARHLGVAASRDAPPERVANWAKDQAALASPAGWAELLLTNRSYNYGFYGDGHDIYLRLRDDTDPNSLYVTVSGGNDAGLTLWSNDVRVSGFELRQFYSAIALGNAASHAVVDHNLFVGSRIGVRTGAAGRGPQTVYGNDVVVQDNRFVDSHLWSSDPVNDPAIPWLFIKANVTKADGTPYETADLGRYNGNAAVSGRGSAQRVVVRRNTIDGLFNALNDGDNHGYDWRAGRDMDIYDNLIRHIADDAIEPEGTVINFRVWNNRVEQASTFLSTGPVDVGPVYVFRNEAWRIGNAGAGPDNSGARGLAGRVFKFSAKSRPPARIYVINNTIWTDQTVPNPIGGGAPSAGGSGSPEAFYLRNNILCVSGAIFEAPTVPGRWDEDYDYFSTFSPVEGLHFRRRFRTDVEAYRRESGQGAHTNVSGDFTTPPGLANPEAGDLSLPLGSPLVDAGTPVPNIADRAGVDYTGAAPDLGAHER
ncbi:MAG: hypothetical protein IT305_13740 [Chloroflexi bacterium]|nr:hypothetical protein [Chloroflexota bacterium]